jgi:hypothetical protein
VYLKMLLKDNFIHAGVCHGDFEFECQCCQHTREPARGWGGGGWGGRDARVLEDAQGHSHPSGATSHLTCPNLPQRHTLQLGHAVTFCRGIASATLQHRLAFRCG